MGALREQRMSLAGTVAALQDAAGYLAAVHQDAVLQAFGSHFCALAACELAETFRALRPASAGNCLPDSIPPQMGRPCFLMSPDEEVEHWVSQLLPLPEDAALNLLRQMCVYSEYIRQHSIEEVAQHMADGVKSMIGATLCADEALEVGPRLGAVMPPPLAVCLLYCSRTTAKPHYFLSDLCFSFLANLVHTGQRVQLYQSDPSMKVAVKYWAIPTGDTTAGKSPSFNLVSDMCVRFLQGQGDLWPWADQEDQNLHSDGTHGLFNEQMRDHSGHVCFVGPEAVNYLSPLYAEKGVCDTSAYVNLPKLLECATGGKYKWGTAREVQQQRAAAKAAAKAAANKAAARERARARGDADSGPSDSPSPAEEETLRPILFNQTNVNVCWFQQVDILRDWWAVAEHKRHLGFVGRMVIGLCLDVAVPPGGRRDGGRVLEEFLTPIWGHVLRCCGAKAHPEPAAAATFLAQTSDALSFEVASHITALRSERRALGYCLKAALGKWEYWLGSVSFLNHAVATALGTEGQDIQVLSAEALKCALRFLDQRLLFGAQVLQTEIIRKFGRAALQTSALPESEAAVAEVLRSVTASIVTHSLMRSHLAMFRRKPGETDEVLKGRRRRVWETAESLGLGKIRAFHRSEAFYKAERSADLDATLQRLGVPIHTWTAAAQPDLQAVPRMLGGAGSAPSSSHASSLSEEDQAVVILFSKVKGPVVTFSSMHTHLYVYRRREGEDAAAVQKRRRKVWEHAAALGLGQIKASGQAEVFEKARRSSEVDAALRRLGFDIGAWPAAATAKAPAPKRRMPEKGPCKRRRTDPPCEQQAPHSPSPRPAPAVDPDIKIEEPLLAEEEIGCVGEQPSSASPPPPAPPVTSLIRCQERCMRLERPTSASCSPFLSIGSSPGLSTRQRSCPAFSSWRPMAFTARAKAGKNISGLA